MKRLQFLLSLLLLLSGVISAQVKANLQIAEELPTVTGKPFPMDGRDFLEQIYKANGIDIKTVAQTHPVLRKVAGPWNFVEGSTHAWKAGDQTTGLFYSVPSTCHKVGNHCYVFVEDSSWNKGRVNQTVVDSVRNAFDFRTPANPSKGIYQTDTETFGSIPDVDNDPHVIILILDIKDGYNPVTSTSYTAGFFDGTNETNSSNSNLAEMYYMDCYPTDLTTASGLGVGLSTCAHEFQHMINWNYKHGGDQTFFNEGCSMIAEWINGYKVDDYLGFYAQSPNRYLLNWGGDNNTLQDYGRATSFFLYLKEQFYNLDNTFFKKYDQSQNTGVDALNIDALPKMTPSQTRTFDDIVVDWWIANFANDKTTTPGLAKWGFDYANYPKIKSTSFVNPNTTNYSNNVNKQAVQYFTFISGKNLNITSFSSSNVFIKLKLIKTGTGGKTVVDLSPPYTNISVPDFGTTYNNVTLMVYNNNRNEPTTGPFTYTFTTTGTLTKTTMELSYVKTEPTGTGGGSDKDTTTILFDGIAGATLDSLKVAMRQAGSMRGAVYASTGVVRPTPLGKKIVGSDFTATSTIATRPPSTPSYPVPWPNWVKVNLTSNTPKINASNTFVVAFINSGDYTATTGNGIMLTTNSETHSAIYLRKPSGGGSANWYTLIDADSNPTDFLVYAYITFGGPTGVKETVELLPSSFKLDQNYPNPFNPSTIISYQIPKASDVQIKIYDMLGKEVSTLINENKAPGTYKINWNGADNFGRKVATGVYFYTIKAGDFIQTKKMVLLK